jgi:hypothetical protein
MLPRLAVLVLVVARPIHRHDLAGHRRVGVVHAVQLVVVLRLQGDHQDGLHLGCASAVRRPHTRIARVGHLRQEVVLSRALEDLLEHEWSERQHSHLYAETLVSAGEVAVVDPFNGRPRPVSGVKEVPAQVVEHRPLRWEHPVQLGPVPRYEEQRHGEVAVRPEHHPVELVEQPVVLLAERVVLESRRTAASRCHSLPKKFK